LRVEPGSTSAAPTATPSFSALRIEGAVKHPMAGESWEYAIVVSVKNERGEEITRQIVGVGALAPGEGRTFSFSVDVFAPDGVSLPQV
jgi:hypothetical protein